MAVVPVSHTFSTTIGASSEMNTYVRDPLNFLMRPPIAELRQIVAQSLANATFVALTFTAFDFDTDVDGIGGHDTGVNPSRFTARYAGIYQGSGVATYVANATGRRAQQWFVNGTALAASQTAYQSTAANDGEFAARTKQFYLNAGDYVELMGYQESGGALATFSTGAGACGASIRWVSN